MTPKDRGRKPWSLLVTLALIGCAHAPRERVAVGEGWAPTRDAALRQAQRDAVEKASGVAIGARTRVENGLVKEQRITASARGRVTGYEVVSEKASEGLYKVQVRARVDSSIVPRPEQSVYVAIAGSMGEAAAAGLKDALTQKGVSVVQNVEQADVVVNGEVAVSPIESVIDLPSARAVLTLKAVDRDGRIVFAGLPAASAVDPRMGNALAKACLRAGEAGALSLSRALVELE